MALKISIDSLPDVDGPMSLEKVVDADIGEFNEFFRSLGNDPIVRGEKAILKTYLAWKLGLMKKE